MVGEIASDSRSVFISTVLLMIRSWSFSVAYGASVATTYIKVAPSSLEEACYLLILCSD
jgi:hypothetical protein